MPCLTRLQPACTCNTGSDGKLNLSCRIAHLADFCACTETAGKKESLSATAAASELEARCRKACCFCTIVSANDPSAKASAAAPALVCMSIDSFCIEALAADMYWAVMPAGLLCSALLLLLKVLLLALLAVRSSLAAKYPCLTQLQAAHTWAPACCHTVPLSCCDRKLGLCWARAAFCCSCWASSRRPSAAARLPGPASGFRPEL